MVDLIEALNTSSLTKFLPLAKPAACVEGRPLDRSVLFYGVALTLSNVELLSTASLWLVTAKPT